MITCCSSSGWRQREEREEGGRQQTAGPNAVIGRFLVTVGTCPSTPKGKGRLTSCKFTSTSKEEVES